jgi:ornithine cyclodeaminase/alanine dehydrogenase-like protein (mu-crystallin family)
LGQAVLFLLEPRLSQRAGTVIYDSIGIAIMDVAFAKLAFYLVFAFASL